MQSVARKPWQKVFVLFAVFSVVCVTLPRKAHAQSGPQAITACTRITQPGSYIVVNNIKATTANLIPSDWGIPGCLVIAADFVTLDLGGFTLFGPGSGINAVGVITGSYAYRGATVRSGEVTNFFIGIYLGSSIGKGGGYVVEHVTAIGNSSTGIEVYTDGARVVGNVAISNGAEGFLILCPSVVAQNMAVSNSSGQIVEWGTCTSSENNPAP
jgi:hypothetical protein